MAGYNTTIIPVSFAPGGTVYINASSTSNTVVINPGTPSNPITAASTAGVLTPAMLLATSYANAISTAADDATTKSSAAYANAISTAADDATTKSSAAYANAVANAAALYQTTAGLSANVAKLTSNNSTNFGGYTWATPGALGTTTANSANFTTVNAASHTVGTAFVANSIGITSTGFANIVSDTASIQVGNATAYFIGNTTGIYPVSNTVSNALGNTTARWVFTGVSATVSGVFTGGGISITGANSNIGSTTAASTVQLGYGATISGALKTINLGTSGAAGSTTNVNIGSTLSNTFVTINANTTTFTGSANVSGAVNFGSTLTTGGQLTVATTTSKVIIGTDSGGSLSLGRIDGTASAPYIDFNSGATAVDYDARISVSAGNGTVGAATLTIAASTLAIGNTTVTGALTTSTYIKTTATVVASLVAAATAGAGARSFVTDSTLGSGNFGNAVVGGGANPVPVYSDGTNWRIG